MSIRATVVALALALALALAGAGFPAAFANNGATQGAGYRDFQYHATNSTKTRAEVQQELEAFRKNPFTTDGTKIVNTEISFVSPQHSSAFQRGALVHTDKLVHDTPKPSLVMTDADKRLQRELYRR